MADQYRVFGLEMSPYSVKVRSWFCYKGIPHEWVPRSMERMAEFQQLARLPLIPLVVTPNGDALQDSTPIIEALESEHPAPATQPDEPVLAFVSALLEEYADEWLNKPMFHYRWYRSVDQASAALRIAREQMPGQPDEALAPVVEFLKQRMVPRLALVGSSETTAGIIEQSWRELLALLNAHLRSRHYLFGGRPALADFGLYGQLRELLSDPTPGALARELAPAVVSYTRRMEDPEPEGEFESLTALWPTLAPIVSDQVGRYFTPWTLANAAALEAGEPQMDVELAGLPFRQQPQKYHARSLRALREKYDRLPEDARKAVDGLLAGTGCEPLFG